MGFSTCPMDIKAALRRSRDWEVVSASAQFYFHAARRTWTKKITQADKVDGCDRIFFRLSGGDFVEVERPEREKPRRSGGDFVDEREKPERGLNQAGIHYLAEFQKPEAR